MELQARPVVSLDDGAPFLGGAVLQLGAEHPEHVLHVGAEQRGGHEPVGVAEQHEEDEPAAHQRDEQ